MAVDTKDDAEFVSLLIDVRQSTIIPLKIVLTGNKEAETNIRGLTTLSPEAAAALAECKAAVEHPLRRPEF
ncbi:MAG: hypothetical protein WCS01_14475 [bacterium]